MAASARSRDRAVPSPPAGSSQSLGFLAYIATEPYLKVNPGCLLQMSLITAYLTEIILYTVTNKTLLPTHS